MTDTALTILMAGIAVSHLHMHRHERNNDNDDCYGNDDNKDDEGGVCHVRSWRTPPRLHLVLARRAWAAVAAARDDNDNDDGEGGNPPVPKMPLLAAVAVGTRTTKCCLQTTMQ